MTTNQIAYWTLQEQKRTNKAKEDETSRANMAKESQAKAELTALEKQRLFDNWMKEAEGQRAEVKLAQGDVANWINAFKAVQPVILGSK